MASRLGFHPPDPSYDPDAYADAPELAGTGHALGADGDDDTAAWEFSRHVYIAVQIGPFAFVLGRPD